MWNYLPSTPHGHLLSIGNSMIYRDIWHKYHERYFQIVIRNFTKPLGEWNLRQFWNTTSGIYAKYHVQIMPLFVYTTTRKGFVILTCRYFKLSWNTNALRQSTCRNFSFSSLISQILIVYQQSWVSDGQSTWCPYSNWTPIGQGLNSNLIEVDSLNFSQQKGWN